MPARKSSADWLQVKEGFSTELDGESVVVSRGEFIRADHPLVKQNPQLFEPIKSRFDTPEVEETTAEPKTKRGA